MALTHGLIEKLEDIRDRHQEVSLLLAEPDVVADQENFTKLSREYSETTPIVNAFADYCRVQSELEEAASLLDDDDAEIRELATETIEELKNEMADSQQSIHILLLPKDPNDAANVYLEIRAGTGGEEAALFAGDLKRMYELFAAANKWNVKSTSETPTGIGGFKQVDLHIEGKDVYAKLKFEAGAHRVQRIPQTESQGRIHTSACTVAVLPEVSHNYHIDIEKSDLRIDTYRASGAGGQHVNKSDSAVRITHIPTNTVAECQQERSQLRNRDMAMSMLIAKLENEKRREIEEQEASDRKIQVGSGDRSERIRTYNFPQSRVTDHRINLTLYKLQEILDGGLGEIVEPLSVENQAQELKKLQASEN